MAASGNYLQTYFNIKISVYLKGRYPYSNWKNPVKMTTLENMVYKQGAVTSITREKMI